MTRTAAEMFCGRAGGWSVGLTWAGVHVVAGCESDAGRRGDYGRRWGVPVLPDVRNARGRDLPPNLWLLAGSPPCQDASEINRGGKGVDGDETGLFFDFIRLAGEARPAWVALENVSGLRTRGADRVLTALVEIGYAPRALVVDSTACGKDHHRSRVFIVAPDTTRRERWAAGQPRPAPRSAFAERLYVDGPPVFRDGLGHVRADTLARHLRAYDGVSSRDAEAGRAAYGDALDPLIPYAIARSLIAWEDGPLFEKEEAA